MTQEVSSVRIKTVPCINSGQLFKGNMLSNKQLSQTSSGFASSEKCSWHVFDAPFVLHASKKEMPGLNGVVS